MATETLFLPTLAAPFPIDNLWNQASSAPSASAGSSWMLDSVSSDGDHDETSFLSLFLFSFFLFLFEAKHKDIFSSFSEFSERWNERRTFGWTRSHVTFVFEEDEQVSTRRSFLFYVFIIFSIFDHRINYETVIIYTLIVKFLIIRIHIKEYSDSNI